MKRSSVVKLIAAMLLIVAVGYCGYRYSRIHTGTQHADVVLENDGVQSIDLLVDRLLENIHS